MKRIALFLLTNIAVVAVLGIVNSLTLSVIERRQEAALWQAFLEHARVHDDIGGLATEMAGGIREFTGRLLAAAGVSATAVPAEALACVLDGLAVATLHYPAAYDRRRVRAILRWQLTRTLT